MSKITFPPALAALCSGMGITISGSAGPLYFRTVRGKTFVCRRPQPTTKPRTPAQLAQQERFARVSQATDTILKDPDQRRIYEQLYRKQPLRDRPASLRAFVFRLLYRKEDE